MTVKISECKTIEIKEKKRKHQKTILELLDNCNEDIQRFKSLKFEFNEFIDLILAYIMQTKLDDSLREQ